MASGEEEKGETERSFDAWWKGKWNAKCASIQTKITFLACNRGDYNFNSLTQAVKWAESGYETEIMTFEEWTAEEGVPSEEKSTLRVCVMAEPANTIEIMEQSYQKARKMGMAVLMVWHPVAKSYGSRTSFVLFFNADTTPDTSECQLFDESMAASLASSWVGEGKSFYYASWTIESTVNAIAIIEAAKVNPEIGEFYQKSGLLSSQGWRKPFGDYPDHKFIPHYLQLLFVDDFRMVLSSDFNRILFMDKTDHCNGYLLDLTDDEITEARRKGEGGSSLVEYRTRNGQSFLTEAKSLVHFRMPPVSLAKCEELTQEYTTPKENNKRTMYYCTEQLKKDSKKGFDEQQSSMLDLTADPLFYYQICLKLKSSVTVTRLFDEFTEELKKGRKHWAHLVGVFGRSKVKTLKYGLSVFGMAPTKEGFTAKTWAINTGDSALIRAVMAFEASQKSSSLMEERMAETHHRWAVQSEHFVQQYIIPQGKAGEQCLRVLSNGLIDLIKNRGDFTAVDLMGMVWHSSDESKRVLLQRLMMALENTLDYNTVHSDKIGWSWVSNVVMKHPLWLSVEEAGKKDDRGSEAEGKGDAVYLGGFAESNEEEGKEEAPEKMASLKILFERVKAIADEQTRKKGGDEIEAAFKEMVAKKKDAWKELCEYKPKQESRLLRQDLIEKGPRSELSEEEVKKITMEVNSLDFNVRRMHDTGQYLTKMLIYAQLVNPHFVKLMGQLFSKLWMKDRVQFAPVKQASRVIPKSEEYGNEGRKWPYSACVIDLVRCSVTVDTLVQMTRVCKAVESFVEDNPSLSMVRCKNGFSAFKNGGLPKKYCDVKFNVRCESEDGSKAIIGEVQVLLKCVLQAKLKAHELYEVSRSLPLYKGAAERVRDEFSFRQQLLLTGGNSKLLIKPLTLYPFCFNIGQFDLSLLLKAHLKGKYFMDYLTQAITLRSKDHQTDQVLPGIVDYFYKLDQDYDFDYLSDERTQLIRDIIGLVPKGSVPRLYQNLLTVVSLGKKLSVCRFYYLFSSLEDSVKHGCVYDASTKRKRNQPPSDHRSIASLTQLYSGFGMVWKSLAFMETTKPPNWAEWEYSNSKPLIDALLVFREKVYDPFPFPDTSNFPDFQFSDPMIEIDKDWVPFVAAIGGDAAVQLFKSNKRVLSDYIGNLAYSKTLPEMNAVFDSMCADHGLARVVASQALSYNLVSRMKLGKATEQSECVKFAKYFSTAGCFDFWADCFPKWSISNANKRRLFPETVLLSPLRRQYLYPRSEKVFVSLFGELRSEECKQLICEDVILEYVNSRDIGEVKMDDLRSLMPNQEWPFLGALLASHEISVECEIPEINRKASQEEWKQWQQSQKESPLLEGWPLHTMLGVLADSVEMTQAVMDKYTDQFSIKEGSLTLPMLFRVDWFDPKSARMVAQRLVDEMQFADHKMLSQWLIDGVVDASKFQFGQSLGLFICALFDCVSALSSESESKEDDSRSGSSPLWSDGCLSVLDALMTGAEKDITNDVVNIAALFSGIPPSIIAQIPPTRLDGYFRGALCRGPRMLTQLVDSLATFPILADQFGFQMIENLLMNRFDSLSISEISESMMWSQMDRLITLMDLSEYPDEMKQIYVSYMEDLNKNIEQCEKCGTEPELVERMKVLRDGLTVRD